MDEPVRADSRWARHATPVATAPNHAGPNQLEFAVTRVPDGPTSNALHGLGEGAVIEADAAAGGWLGRRDDERALAVLFVATGSGLAPFRGLLQEELSARSGPPIGCLPDRISSRFAMQRPRGRSPTSSSLP